MWHKGTGVIVYDPNRGNMKNRVNWWCVINVDKEITRYYRWWVMKEKWIDLNLPSFDAHISVVRGEAPKPEQMHLWKKYHGQTVEFRYKHEVRQTSNAVDRTDHYWFVDVDCPMAKHIREELGRPSHWIQHLTIGRTY